MSGRGRRVRVVMDAGNILCVLVKDKSYPGRRKYTLCLGLGSQTFADLSPGITNQDRWERRHK